MAVVGGGLAARHYGWESSNSRAGNAQGEVVVATFASNAPLSDETAYAHLRAWKIQIEANGLASNYTTIERHREDKQFRQCGVVACLTTRMLSICFRGYAEGRRS
ncbi:unnamed protein product [Soboliphyme baturini]|uniref:SCP domain-containing protein n=1 Tax=Soboliphyme baturini TaxID=241478 RepID=A0A183IHN2_9BILA|nr:unnamed protein product [Soboliphyme baturini]